MTYIRLDDRFPSHRKALAAGPYGRDLYVCGLAYCSVHLTDGVIPREALETISSVPPSYAGRGARAWSNIVRQTAECLVRVGLWEHVEGIGYRVHDFHDWNKSASQINELKNARAVAGRRGGEAKRKHTARALLRSDEANSEQRASEATNPSTAASIPPTPLEALASSNSSPSPTRHDWPHGADRFATRWLPGRYPFGAFHHDCPDPAWRGRCVRSPWAQEHPGQFPVTPQGTPKQCPHHRGLQTSEPDEVKEAW
jgi:hypothetical protein